MSSVGRRCVGAMETTLSANKQQSCAAALVAALLILPAAVAQPTAPDEIIRNTTEQIASTIEAHYAELAQDVHALYALIDEQMLPHFDFERGSRAILAEHWAPATVDQRLRFSMAFYNYLVASYGDLLIHFNHDTIRVMPFEGNVEEPLVNVSTILTLNDGTEVDVDFLMISTDGDWRIVDVIAEGISYVRTYRSQFRIQIATDTLESVIAWLNEKAAPRLAP